MLRHLCKSVVAVAAILFAFTLESATSFAEEVIIEEGKSLGIVSIGDYYCSPCFSKLGADSFEMKGDGRTIEMTAGELWQFFDKQGYDSVNTMTLFLDVDELGSDQSFNLSKLNVQIQNPVGGSLLTDANLGTDRLIVPGYETSSSRPEAELRFDLGYDFMKLFSPDSTEIVRVSIDSPMAGMMAPKFHLAADDNVFGQSNLGQMFLFIVFWGAVFLMLLRWMKPVRERNPATVPVRATMKPSAPSTVRQRTA